jgi:photosystem II stability/assembly factor-like uncharacterized protein
LLVVALLAATGCSGGATHVGDLRVTGEIRPGYDHRPAPPDGPAPGASNVAFADAQLGVLVADGDSNVGVGQIQRTTDGGRTWHTVFSGAHVGFGGRTWARRTLPYGGDDVELGVAPGLLTETHGFNPRELAISADGGASWRVVRFPRGYRNVGALAGRGRTLSISADRVGAGGEQYLSFDGGATWSRIRGHLPEIVTLDGAELWGVDEFRRNALWHSSDGGRHWTEVWPRLP